MQKILISLCFFMSISWGQGTDDVTVAEGSTYNGSIQTTSGDITVYENARVKQNITTTNGDIYLEAGSRAKEVTTTNGDIFIAENVTIDKSVGSVNGSIFIESGTSIKNDVISLSGDIRINGAQVKKNVKIRDGSLIMNDGAVIKKKVEVLDRGGNSGNSANLEIVEIYVGYECVIKGDIKVDSHWDNVELEISGDSTQVQLWEPGFFCQTRSQALLQYLILMMIMKGSALVASVLAEAQNYHSTFGALHPVGGQS